MKVKYIVLCDFGEEWWLSSQFRHLLVVCLSTQFRAINTFFSQRKHPNVVRSQQIKHPSLVVCIFVEYHCDVQDINWVYFSYAYRAPALVCL
jgi:hypothetical protein